MPSLVSWTTPPSASHTPVLNPGMWTGSPLARSALTTGLVGGALAWCYWPTLLTLAERWRSDAHYSHGFLVPVFALLLLIGRRGSAAHGIADKDAKPQAAGLGILLAAVLLRLTAAWLYFEPLDAWTLLPTLVGLALTLGGWPALRWSWPAIAFLAFMLPLPFQIETALAVPLRRMATHVSVYLLQLLGYPALADGNVILLDEARLGVAEACSGLGMLMTFFALATALALVIRAPVLDRITLIVSAVPIAVLANVLRITATAVAHESLGADVAQTIMHDLAGWLMMPIALALLYLELRLLGLMLLPTSAPQPLPIVPVFERNTETQRHGEENSAIRTRRLA